MQLQSRCCNFLDPGPRLVAFLPAMYCHMPNHGCSDPQNRGAGESSHVTVFRYLWIKWWPRPNSMVPQHLVAWENTNGASLCDNKFNANFVFIEQPVSECCFFYNIKMERIRLRENLKPLCPSIFFKFECQVEHSKLHEMNYRKLTVHGQRNIC